MLFAHLKRILKLDRLRLRGPNPNGARDEFILAETAQNLRKIRMTSAAGGNGALWSLATFDPVRTSFGSIATRN